MSFFIYLALEIKTLSNCEITGDISHQQNPNDTQWFKHDISLLYFDTHAQLLSIHLLVFWMSENVETFQHSLARANVLCTFKSF